MTSPSTTHRCSPAAAAVITLLLASVFAGGSGCSRTVLVKRQVIDYEPDDVSAELDFWHTLPDRSAVTNDEGLHGLLLFADGADPARSYEQRVTLLKSRGWLSSDFDEAGNMVMERGTLAKLLSHALEIDGGVMMRLTDKNRRYSTRELVYLGIMGAGTEQQALSGIDYIGVISKAQDWQTSQAASRVAASPPAEPAPASDADAEPATPQDQTERVAAPSQRSRPVGG